MSIVCSEQLADRCSIGEVAVAVKMHCAQAITTGEAQQGQVLDLTLRRSQNSSSRSISLSLPDHGVRYIFDVSLRL
jgi:hypothetical protein